MHVSMLLRTAAMASVAAGCCFTSIQSAEASPLNPGATLFPAPSGAFVTGTFETALFNVPFSTPQFSGTLTTIVYSASPQNSLGGLTFLFRLVNDAGSTVPIHRLTINGYSGFLVDSYYEIFGNVAPTLINRTGDGNVIGFSFEDVVGPGQIYPSQLSEWLIVHTNATAYTESFASVIDGTVTTVATLAPLVPTPGTAALGALGIVFASRRRRR